ncbi:olfactory receptor 2K2-like [Ambystoma mexicanum]|uniref:olfactory receptor 2K2-like n=1 Tax=Ambystoma mexicanum TaxID=8296 RepID=UPI0037E8D0E2
MERQNHTFVREFILLGLSRDPEIQIILFVVFLIIYISIIIGNTLILTAIKVVPQLHTPMYFFLSNLSFLDMCYSTMTVPKMLENLLSDKKTISFAGCAAQMYLSLSMGETECILLAIMAYDRYVAICYPLRYMTIMNKHVCLRLATGTWICGFILSILHVAFTLQVPLCGNNQINHFECEVPAVLRLACVDVSLIGIIIFVVGILILMIPISLILVSYVRIIISILQISSAKGRYKAFSTCGSHIMVVVLFYGTAMYIYMKPQSNDTQDTDKIVTVAYTVITPMMNPIIYTLRNKEVKGALKKTIQIIYAKKH